MLSPESLERYRRMSPGERLELTFKLTEDADAYLFVGTPEQVKRKFALLRRQNDERNRRMFGAIAHTMPGFYERCDTVENPQITRRHWDDKAGIMRKVDRMTRREQ
jgi:hypothetical protein